MDPHNLWTHLEQLVQLCTNHLLHALQLWNRGADLWKFLSSRFGLAATKAKLQRTCFEAAWGMQTASTLRIGRIQLRTSTELRAALELQSEGCGYVRYGCYEVWVNTIPAPLQQMIYSRSLSRRFYI
jgi:hypothetical protein